MKPREDWPRLGSYVISARKRAGYPTRRAFAAAIGVTDRTLAKLEGGERVGPDTLSDVAEGVGWTPDSPRLVLQGDEPIILDDPGSALPRPNLAAVPDDSSPEDAEFASLSHAAQQILREVRVAERIWASKRTADDPQEPPAEEIFERRTELFLWRNKHMSRAAKLEAIASSRQSLDETWASHTESNTNTGPALPAAVITSRDATPVVHVNHTGSAGDYMNDR